MKYFVFDVIIYCLKFYRVFNLHSKSVKHTIDVQQNSKSLKPVLTLEEFHNVVIPMLISLGPGLHRDPVLMFKVVRIAREALIRVNIFNYRFLPFFI